MDPVEPKKLSKRRAAIEEVQTKRATGQFRKDKTANQRGKS